MSDAEYLRETAALMRERAEASTLGPRPPTFLFAVADSLITAAADIWAHGPLCECSFGCDACDDALWEPHARRALATARAYRGESNE